MDHEYGKHWLTIPNKNKHLPFGKISEERSKDNSRPISQESSSIKLKRSRKNSFTASKMSDSPTYGRISSLNDPTYSNTGGDDLAANVASKFIPKVTNFLDYTSVLLRRRLERELLKPVQLNVNFPIDNTRKIAGDDGDTSARMELHRVNKIAELDNISNLGKISKSMLGASSVISKRKALEETKKLLRQTEVRQKFRKKTRIILFCIRCVKEHGFKFRERSELTPYMNTLNYIDYRADQVTDLMFDRSKFRADRQMRISEETKRILSIKKTDRTDHEVYCAQLALRNIKDFAQLPARMQKMIARVGHYESFESKRVITREGHSPANFYFILSGAVVAMKMDPERPIASAVNEFVKGDSFEENPLLHETHREVTTITKEPCELLSISAMDYKDIFMQGGGKNLNDPDQEHFLKSLKFLIGWPIKILTEHPKECLFHYFKQGAILADDTQKSKWLIIVKSGSISVLKKLKKVGPFEWRKHSGLKPLSEKEKRERHTEKKMWRRYVLAELKLPFREETELEEIEERVDGKPKAFNHPDIKVHQEKNGANGSKYYYPNLWTYKGAEDDNNNNNNNNKFSNINKQYLYVMSSSSPKDGRKIKDIVVKKPTVAVDIHAREDLKVDVTPNLLSMSSSTVSETSLLTICNSPSGTQDTLRSRASDEQTKKASRHRTSSRSQSFSEVDLNPQFVQIQTLIKGDVWGLADLMLDVQPRFMIVSNGADCLLITKQFYLQHCTEKLERKLKQDLCPYPTDADLQESLQVSVDWQDYCRCELMSTVDSLKSVRGTSNPALHPKTAHSC